MARRLSAPPQRPDAAVIGGGVIGLAAAWQSAKRGLQVTLVDPAPGSGASAVAAGMLAPVTEVHFGEEALLSLNLASAERWPAFARELEDDSGRRVGLREDGTVAVAYDADDRAALDRLLDYQRRLGLPAERLRGREVRALEPMLSPAVRGGMVARGDGRVDPRLVTGALVEACRRVGVRFVDRAATSVEPAGGGSGSPGRFSVGLEGGKRLEAGAAVVCTGASSARLAGVPVRPVKGQILTVRGRGGEPLLGRAVRGLVRGESIYLVPRDDGRLVIGATVEEKAWDTSVTAGAVYELLRDATLLVPGVSELELVETLAGLRPGTPDNAPVIGRDSRGVVVASGHYRNGVLLTPITAHAVADLLETGRVPAVASPFGPERFR